MSKISGRPFIVWVAGSLVLLAAFGRTVVCALCCIRWPAHSGEAPFEMVVLPLAMLAALWSIGVGLFMRWSWARWATVVLFAFWIGYTLSSMPTSFPRGGRAGNVRELLELPNPHARRSGLSAMAPCS